MSITIEREEPLVQPRITLITVTCGTYPGRGDRIEFDRGSTSFDVTLRDDDSLARLTLRFQDARELAEALLEATS